ncbi:transglutaminase family protein [Pontiella agarivorans]|uniref:Transglutaminase family protein n=1 Tax=Pontiella agarivorans TaxID=3038953 RepID=A0ABU5MTY7_9BACT|nr:transglutaminase family protein [Pontiella agarivorans]MDZ8117685.1 transglutaminase family protein [Pontiella agarivorans]
MMYHLRHRTTFEYSNPVTFVYNVLRLKPRTLPWQQIRSSKLTIFPEPAVLAERTDYFGNTVTFCNIEMKHDSMQILMESTVEVQPRPTSTLKGVAWDTVRERLRGATSPEGLDAFQFCFDSEAVSRLAESEDYCRPSCKPGASAHAVAIDLMARIHTDFIFDPTATTVSTPVEDVLKNRRGVCQDFAHLMISCLRSVGIPTRYNSGYIQTAPPPGQPRLEGADASHAWVGVYCPVNGWLDLDPTNNQIADDQFITIGWGRDYQDISPVSGVMLGGGRHQVRAEVDMIPESELQQFQQQQQ